MTLPGWIYNWQCWCRSKCPWGGSTWGSFEWVTNAQTLAPIRLQTLGPWTPGSIRIACATSDGKIYQWANNTGAAAAVLSNAPTKHHGNCRDRRAFYFCAWCWRKTTALNGATRKTTTPGPQQQQTKLAAKTLQLMVLSRPQSARWDVAANNHRRSRCSVFGPAIRLQFPASRRRLRN